MPQLRLPSKSLPDRLFETLLRQILCGNWRPGDRLPPERALAARYGTNRNTLREAIRKLEQARLVTVRHGSGVTVEDFRKKAGIDMAGPFLEHSNELAERTRVLGDLLMARAKLLEIVVRMAAERAEPGNLSKLADLTEQQLAAFERQDRAALIRGDLEWVDALVEASHSLAIQWIANTIFELYRNLMRRFPLLWEIRPDFPDYLRGVTAALAERKADEAVTLTREYCERTDAVLLNKIDALVKASAT